MAWLLNQDEFSRCTNESGVLISSPLDLVPLSSKIGEKRVIAELTRITAANSLERGFHVTVVGSPNVWRVDFFNFPASLSNELENKKLHLVTVLVCFEGGFPISAGPSFRVVTPRLNFFSSSSQLLAGGIVSMDWKVRFYGLDTNAH